MSSSDIREESIQVHTRILRSTWDEEYLSVDADQQWLHVGASDKRQSFKVERCYEGPSQEEIAETIIPSVIGQVEKGFNSCVLVYGQTGSGKTYTMFGRDSWKDKQFSLNDPFLGIVPRIIKHIFCLDGPGKRVLVTISMYEIYKETIRDILDPSPKRMFLQESGLGCIVKGVEKVFPTSVDEALQIVQGGLMRRAVAETSMNKESSRSHTITQLHVEIRQGEDSQKSTINLVDLAGSERAHKTNVSGNTLQEANYINTSLCALGQVIKSLSEKQTHVPYRNSKLTRALKESLGGNAVTVLITNINDNISESDETISTLRFGQSAQKVKNRLILTKEPTGSELKQRISNLTKRLQTMRRYSSKLESILIENDIVFADAAKEALLDPVATADQTSDQESAARDQLPAVPSAGEYSPILQPPPVVSAHTMHDSMSELMQTIIDRDEHIAMAEREAAERQEELNDCLDQIISLQEMVLDRESQLKAHSRGIGRRNNDLTPGNGNEFIETSRKSVGSTFAHEKIEELQAELREVVAERDYYLNAATRLNSKYEDTLRLFLNNKDEEEPGEITV